MHQPFTGGRTPRDSQRPPLSENKPVTQSPWPGLWGEAGNWHDSPWPLPVVSSPPAGSGDSGLSGSPGTRARPVGAPGTASCPSQVVWEGWRGPHPAGDCPRPCEVLNQHRVALGGVQLQLPPGPHGRHGPQVPRPDLLDKPRLPGPRRGEVWAPKDQGPGIPLSWFWNPQRPQIPVAEVLALRRACGRVLGSRVRASAPGPSWGTTLRGGQSTWGGRPSCSVLPRPAPPVPRPLWNVIWAPKCQAPPLSEVTNSPAPLLPPQGAGQPPMRPSPALQPTHWGP